MSRLQRTSQWFVVATVGVLSSEDYPALVKGANCQCYLSHCALVIDSTYFWLGRTSRISTFFLIAQFRRKSQAHPNSFPLVQGKAISSCIRGNIVGKNCAQKNTVFLDYKGTRNPKNPLSDITASYRCTMFVIFHARQEY